MIQPIAVATRPTDERAGKPPAWWAMILLIFTEAAIFASLLLAYFYERGNATHWPPVGIDKPELPLPIAMTVALTGCSVAMWFGERAIAAGRSAMLMVCLCISVLLAALFLGMQAYEYTHETFDLGNSVYSSVFFTITGLHGMHVAVAVALGLVLILRTALGHFTASRRDAVSIVALYWHFVDAVWLFIFAALYLSPHLF